MSEFTKSVDISIVCFLLLREVNGGYTLELVLVGPVPKTQVRLLLHV